MQCLGCGLDLPESARFCARCGEALGEAPEPLPGRRLPRKPRKSGPREPDPGEPEPREPPRRPRKPRKPPKTEPCELCGAASETGLAAPIPPERMVALAHRGLGRAIGSGGDGDGGASGLERQLALVDRATARTSPWQICGVCAAAADRLEALPTRQPGRSARAASAAAILVLVASASLALTLYGLLPLVRCGLRLEGDARALPRLAERAERVLASSDLLLVECDGALTVARLDVATARLLYAEGVEVRSHRDLPGVVPFAVLAAALALLCRAAWGRRALDGPRAFSTVFGALAAAGSLAFYVWYWTFAADHHPGAGPDGPGGLAGAGDLHDLYAWRRACLVLAPFWLVGMAVLRRFVRDFFFAGFLPLFLATLYATIVLAIVVLFPPDPYWRYAALGWWPLAFGGAVAGVGLGSLAVVARAQRERWGIEP